MTEQKTYYSSVPVTEELLKTLDDNEDYMLMKGNRFASAETGRFIKCFSAAYSHILIETPLPSLPHTGETAYITVPPINISNHGMFNISKEEADGACTCFKRDSSPVLLLPPSDEEIKEAIKNKLNEKRSLSDSSPLIDPGKRRSFESGAIFGYKLALSGLSSYKPREGESK